MPARFFQQVFAIVIWVSAFFSAAATTFGAVPPAVNSANVIAAIKRGVNFLLAHENMAPGGKTPCWETGIKEGSVPLLVGRKQSSVWKKVSQYGGETALVTEALLDVNQSLHIAQLNPFSPPMRKAIRFVTKLHPKTTYAASLQANAMTLLPDKQAYHRVLKMDRGYLLRSIHRDGSYFYAMSAAWPPNPSLPGIWDNSNTQYGVLGMWACAHQGLPIPYKYWGLAANHWRTGQYANGAWTYNSSGDQAPAGTVPTGTESMTPVGLASLFICDEFLLERPTVHPTPDPHILRGLAWINKHFSPDVWNLYTMYGYERVALASGLQTFAGHNWYRDFARSLLAHQNGDGSWPGNLGGVGADEYIGTAYALLILDRGLNPVLINKLQYTKNFYGQWNARQRDLANVTSWISRTFETSLNWQLVSIHTPVADWLDSPILYINGYKYPRFTKKQVAKIRVFVNAGGMVFCNCDSSSQRFERAMIQYGQRVVRHQYEVHRLAQSSLVYHMLPGYKFAQSPGLLAISNGIRDVWIISSRDLGATWQNRAFSRREDWNIPASLYLYATGKGYLANKLCSLNVPLPVMPTVRSMAMSQIMYNGNWNPEPGAWPRMAQLAKADFQTTLTIADTPIANLNAKTHPLAHLTGTGKFNLTTEQIAALKTYIAQGGMIFVDSGGGNSSFTNSFAAVVQKLVPNGQFVDMPEKSSICTGSNPGGINAQKVKYRKFYLDSHRHRTTPILQGIKVHGRWVVVFSPWDITSGLLGTNTWGINGYSPESAQNLARNVIVYAIAKH